MKIGHSKPEDTITDTVDKQLKGIMAVLDEQAQNLHNFSGDLQSI
jgi:hypothetical protein